jgi:hypothetical protein
MVDNRGIISGNVWEYRPKPILRDTEKEEQNGEANTRSAPERKGITDEGAPTID